MADFTSSMIAYLKNSQDSAAAARQKARAKKGIPDDVTEWQMMPDWLAAKDDQKIGRAASNAAMGEAWFESFMSKIVGDPSQTLGGIIRQRAKPALDRRFSTPPQQVADAGIPGGIRKQQIRGGHAIPRFGGGGVGKAHRLNSQKATGLSM